MSVETKLETKVGDLQLTANGYGNVLGDRAFAVKVASVSAGAVLTSIQERIFVPFYHRLRKVSFGVSAVTAVSAGTDPAADLYRHLPVPVGLAAALASTPAAGNVDDGAHMYAVVFYNAVGNGPQSAPVTVTVADHTVNGQVTVTLPLGPTGTTGRKLYRTAAAGAALLLLATVANNTATSYTDNTADSGLGAGIGTANVAGATVLGSTVKLSVPAATAADQSLLDTPLDGTLASGAEVIWPPCMYTVRALTGASTGAITNLYTTVIVEACPD